MWESQDRHTGDRQRLFNAIAIEFVVTSSLYPGCYVDIAPSFVFESVTYVDTDDRAARFFGDRPAVDEMIQANRTDQTPSKWRFIYGDYTSTLDLPIGGFDLLISLYAGFVSQHCAHHLRPGGYLLANPSHGDVASAHLDERFSLVAVVTSRGGTYSVRRHELEEYLVPRGPEGITSDALRQRGRGIGYTRSPFAYLFQFEPQR